MSPNAESYLEKPSPKKWAKLTSEEQRFVKREGGGVPAKKAEPKKGK